MGCRGNPEWKLKHFGESTWHIQAATVEFMKIIPGSRFYIGQSSISNLNVRFVARDQTLISLAEKILDAEDTNSYEAANSQHPDIYS